MARHFPGPFPCSIMHCCMSIFVGLDIGLDHSCTILFGSRYLPVFTHVPNCTKVISYYLYLAFLFFSSHLFCSKLILTCPLFSERTGTN